MHVTRSENGSVLKLVVALSYDYSTIIPGQIYRVLVAKYVLPFL